MWRAVLDEARIGMRSTRRWRDDHRVSQRPIGKMSSDAEPQKGPRRCSRASQGREGLFSDPTDPRLPHPFPHPQSRKASVICELKLQGVLRGACIRELSSQNPFVLPAILLTVPKLTGCSPLRTPQ